VIVTTNNGLPYVEVCMSSIHNHNFSIYSNLPALKKRVLIISYKGIGREYKMPGVSAKSPQMTFILFDDAKLISLLFGNLNRYAVRLNKVIRIFISQLNMNIVSSRSCGKGYAFSKIRIELTT